MGLFSFRKQQRRANTHGKHKAGNRSRRLRVEMLEDRRVLATIFVDDGSDCPNADFATIQEAVDAADVGDKIIVCKGTYTEQVTIPSSKDDLELRAKNSLQAIIKAPAGLVTPGIVHIDGADDVEIIGFKITGPLDITTSSPPPIAGIFVGGGGSAIIERNHITKIRSEPLGGLQNGVGILIGSTTLVESGSAEIERNEIDDYQKAGIVVDTPGSDAKIKDNEIKGIGPTAVIAQVGIQVSNEATAEIEKNEISKNQYVGPDPFALGAGILLVESGRTKVKNNDIERNDVGIDMFDLVNKTEISHNDVERSDWYGISVTTSTNVEVKNNDVSRSGLEGIVLDTSTLNKIENNKVERNGTSGILLLVSDNNRIEDNRLQRNGEDGILVEDSNDNRIKDNRTERNGRDGIRVIGSSANNRLTSNKNKKNTEHDCHDDTFGLETAGTANIWENNSGDSENVPGLCD